MKYWLSVAVVAGLMLAPVAGQAATKKMHRSHMHRAAQTNANMRTPGAFDPARGNAAAGGNNGNSMSGSNSAPENPEGRANGSGGFGQ